jgi:hypothetical protein
MFNRKGILNSLIIWRLASLWKSLQRPPKRSHTIGQISLLVLRHSELYVTKHKLIIQSCRFCVILCSLCEFVHDEEHCKDGQAQNPGEKMGDDKNMPCPR